MSARRISLILVLFLLPVDSWADRHKFGAIMSWDHAKRSDLGGVGLAIDYAPCKERGRGSDNPDTTICVKRHPVSGLVAFSRVSGTHDDEELTQRAIMAGARATYSFGHGSRVEPFAHALVGLLHESTTSGSDDSLAGSFGWGFDFVVNPSDHALELTIGPRMEMFWIDRADTTEWFPQLSVAVVVRIP